MFRLAAVNTYKNHSVVAALQRLEEVCHPGLQPTTNRDTIINMIEEDGSESVYVTWDREWQHLNHSPA